MKPFKHTLHAGLLLILFAGLVACDDILSVDNPGSIDESDLSDPALEQTIINGVIGEFQYTHSYSSLWTGVVSDELLLDHTHVPTIPMVLRTFDESNVYVNNVYSFWQRSRASADDAVDRLEELHGDDAFNSLNMLKALSYGGYSYILLGETFCAAPVNVSEAYSSSELFGFALDRFEEAMDVADAAEAAGEPSADVERYRNFVQLGAARASLNLGNFDDAISYAEQVDADFEKWNRHSDNSSRQYNPFQDPTTGANNRHLSPGLPFQELDDPRVTHTDEKMTSLVEGTMMYIPFQPFSFSGWSLDSPNQEFTRNADVRIASSLEAEYIIAEAEGAQGSTTDALTLINERRDFAGQDPFVSIDNDEIMEELRVQRSRDFYLTGKRLGDLRRYVDLYDVDLFPSGTDPFQDETYGDQRCLVIPQSEINDNPNL